MKKSERLRNQSTLDLHHIRFLSGESPQEAVYRELDKFMTRWFLSRSADITIIVGKGLGSKKFINGKNMLRHYTEEYLTLAGCEWTNDKDWAGQEGVIRVRW